jgi:hypothetical protein
VTRWEIIIQDEEAGEELAFLLQDTQKAKDVRALLQKLASQDDPRRPTRDSGLDIKEVEHDAPNWFRLRIDTYNLRILFRLLVRRGTRIIQLGPRELPIGDDEPLLDITQAVERFEAYGQKTRQRYRHITKE